MPLTVMRQSQSARCEEAEPASGRRASGACQITLMWDNIVMSPQTNLAATNCNRPFGKTRVSGRWVGAGTEEVAAGRSDTQRLKR